MTLTRSARTSSTAATSSMATPVLLIRDISLTPIALMIVVKMISDGAEDHGVGGEVVLAGAVAVELEEVVDHRQRDLVRQRDGGDGDDRRREHHPAGEPGHVRRAEPLGPVVDRAGDRVARGELAEAERDHQLAGEHQRPRPPVRRAAEREAEVEELERAGEDRDVADPRRERGEAPERAVELLLVAELGELGVVAERVGQPRVMPHPRSFAPSPTALQGAGSNCARVSFAAPGTVKD